MNCKKSQRGFTLLELLIAILIIAVVAGVLLDMRVDILRDATRIKARKIAWELAARQLSAIEMDQKQYFKEPTSGGDKFEDYEDFTYEYLTAKEELPTNDPNDPNQKPKEIMKLTLTVRLPDSKTDEDNVVLESYFPVYEDPQLQPQQPR